MRTTWMAALGAVVLTAAAAPAAQAQDKLPDLRMGKPYEIRINTASDGRRLLKYSIAIVNVGRGRFEARGTRSTGQSRMTVRQRIYDTQGGYRTILLPSTTFMVYAPSEPFYGGDGHNHWHLNDLESASLTRLDGASPVRALAKHGFCVYDNTKHSLWRSGAPSSSYYTGCGTRDSTSVRMGLSVGWGDTYRYYRANQWIDVTGLPDGTYRLRTQVESARQGFVEADTTNNYSWVDVRITGLSVSVTQVGPHA